MWVKCWVKREKVTTFVPHPTSPSVVVMYRQDMNSFKQAISIYWATVFGRGINIERTGMNTATRWASLEVLVSREWQGGNKHRQHPATEAMQGNEVATGTPRRGPRIRSCRAKDFQDEAIKMRPRGKLIVKTGHMLCGSRKKTFQAKKHHASGSTIQEESTRPGIRVRWSEMLNTERVSA